MTRDDIICMGQIAGILDPLCYNDPTMKNWRNDVLWKLERFAALVVAADRESRAMVISEMGEKMNKHTPGPWVYGLRFDSENQRAKITTVAHCGDYVIGLASAYPGGDYRQGDPCGAEEADAKLIAAAPDLLAAAEAIKIDSDEVVDYGVGCTSMLVPIDTYKKLMDAIAKATGGAS